MCLPCHEGRGDRPVALPYDELASLQMPPRPALLTFFVDNEKTCLIDSSWDVMQLLEFKKRAKTSHHWM